MVNFSNLSRCAVAAAALAFGGGAHATLVTNGGFETGAFSGWTQFGNTGRTSVANSGFQPTGDFAALFGPVGSSGGIFQTLPTVAGQTYDIGFWLENLFGGWRSATFNWDGGEAELELTEQLMFQPTAYSYALTASSASIDLRFTFQQNFSLALLDDVSVNVANRVPEPASLALVGLALAGAAVATRKKRSA